MLRWLWVNAVRFRTWLLNSSFLVLLLPDLLISLAGFDWSPIIPARYLPYIALANLVLNVWMRPRPAVMAHDPEAAATRLRKVGELLGD